MTQEQTAEERFGAQVRAAREAQGWTQERLRAALRAASGIELSSTAMARLEQGKRPIRLNEVSALAQVLGLSVHQYGGGAGGGLTREKYEQARERLVNVRAQAAEQYERLLIARRRADQAVEDLAQAERRFFDMQAQLEELQVLVTAYEDADKATNQRVDPEVEESRIRAFEREQARLKLEAAKINADRERGFGPAQPRHGSRRES
ncbi:helix-turn-helix domain-containing protein [Micromonospora sp. NPDC047738]|uniref:helix-turn-helix domain-containing protein n=1 Tax=Micromonospora sp. NPDC047738 TaxID=3155741 RepID=UPI0033F2E210